MDTEILIQAGLSEIQAKIYLYLVENGQTTPSKIAEGVDENRTTVYSALEKLEKSNLVLRKDKGKISAYVPNHPSALESLAEKRLRQIARQARNLESNLPSLINFYNEHQNQPGATTFYGREGVKMIYNKIVATGKTFYFIRSPHDGKAVPEDIDEFKKNRLEKGIEAKSIAPSEYTKHSREAEKRWKLARTFLPPGEYNSPVEIDIFGDNIAFINYSKDGMSTLIESPEIADAMRQVFLFAKKYISKATNQEEIISDIESRIEKSDQNLNNPKN